MHSTPLQNSLEDEDGNAENNGDKDMREIENNEFNEERENDGTRTDSLEDSEGMKVANMEDYGDLNQWSSGLPVANIASPGHSVHSSEMSPEIDVAAFHMPLGQSMDLEVRAHCVSPSFSTKLVCRKLPVLDHSLPDFLPLYPKKRITITLGKAVNDRAISAVQILRPHRTVLSVVLRSKLVQTMTAMNSAPHDPRTVNALQKIPTGNEGGHNQEPIPSTRPQRIEEKKIIVSMSTSQPFLMRLWLIPHSWN